MSDPEVPQPEQPTDVDDVVDSARAGLADAAAAGADVPGYTADVAKEEIDPDLAAFAAAETEHPGTFSGASIEESETVSLPNAENDAEAEVSEVIAAPELPESAPAVSGLAESAYAESAPAPTAVYTPPVADEAQTTVVPSEPLAPAAPLAQQPIFVQAPEPPRDRGNRGTAGLIGLLATIVFAVLYLGTSLGLGALAGTVTAANIAEAALAPLSTWGFWIPVVAFFLGFWLLGALINRGRWGLWVIFGILVGLISYGGYLLGLLFEAPFWVLTAAQGSTLLGENLLAPLAIASFVFGRELTIWFGAWIARIGAHKIELNAEAQREYERTLEAGPTLPQ